MNEICSIMMEMDVLDKRISKLILDFGVSETDAV
jgi:hypothetical protein